MLFKLTRNLFFLIIHYLLKVKYFGINGHDYITRYHFSVMDGNDFIGFKNYIKNGKAVKETMNC